MAVKGYTGRAVPGGGGGGRGGSGVVQDERQARPVPFAGFGVLGFRASRRKGAASKNCAADHSNEGNVREYTQ